MYLSKSKKRNIIIFIAILLISLGVVAFLLLQKPKIDLAQIAGSGYSGSDLTVSVLPLDATVSYQWRISDSAEGPFVDVSGATLAKLSLGYQDVGKFYKVFVKGLDKYAGSIESTVFGPIKGVVITWPTTTALNYGQALSASTLGNGIALINGIHVPGIFSFETPDVVPSSAGIYKAVVVFTPTDLNKYKTISSSVDVVVNKAELTITIDNQNVIYGDFLKDFTYSITGFIMNDDITSITGTPTITSVYSPGLDISFSPIQIIGEIGTLVSDNYSFKFVYGNINITKRTLTIGGLSGNDKTYDGTTAATASGTARLVNLFLGDNVTIGGYPNFTFVQFTAGDNVRINVKGYTLRGTKAANYILVQPVLYADINPIVTP
ncbi:MAG: hypothetical protein HGB31_00970 [Erysipelotrichaceae bacterium]|nr:hypothetical protein [Erysipelotrichaceae bacterium]